MIHINIRLAKSHAGYALPILVVLSTTFLILGVSILQVITSLRVTLDDQYKTSLAREAAESGVAYATSCLQKSNYVAGWSNAKPLTQSTDCLGNPKNAGSLSFLPDQVMLTNTIKTTFSVGALTTQDAISQTIQAKGMVYTKTGGTFISSPSNTQDAQTRVKRTDYGNNTFTYRSRGACSIRENTVECRGSNDFGQLGRGAPSGARNDKYPNAPIALPASLTGKAITKVDGGANHVCLIAEGQLWCWGYNSSGQVGNGNTTDQGTPQRVTAGGLGTKTIIDVQAFNNTTCVIAKSVSPPSDFTTLKNTPGKIYCWGDNHVGQVGIGTRPANADTGVDNQLIPLAVNTGAGQYLPATYDATSLSKGGGGAVSVCVIANRTASTDEREGYCWGDNGYGQLGNSGTNLYDESPINAPYRVYQEAGVLAGKKLLTISTEGLEITNADNPYGFVLPIPRSEVAAHTCAIADDFKAYCWGSNRLGELGRHNDLGPPATNPQSNNPYANTGLALVAQGCGFLQFCRSTHNRPLPVDGSEQANPNIGSAALRNKTVTDIVTTIYSTCAIADGKPYCWGSNLCGALGRDFYPPPGANGDCPNTDFFYRPGAGDTDQAVPVVDHANVFTGKRLSALSGAGWSVCMVAGKGVVCWGRSDFYEAGLTTNPLELVYPLSSDYIKPLFPDYSY